jgi:hypothetical protein
VIRIEARRAVASLDLSILPDADPDQPGCATKPEALALPSALHHPRVRSQGRHIRSLERDEDPRSGHFVPRAARSLERGGPSVTGGRDQRANTSLSVRPPGRPALSVINASVRGTTRFGIGSCAVRTETHDGR